MKIESGTGNGFYAGVDKNNRLRVASVVLPRQHVVSKVDQKSFQLIGEAIPTNGTTTVLHIENNTTDQSYSVTYLREIAIDLAGGTAIPSAANYFRLVTGLEYASGGTVTSAVNTYTNSAVVDGGTHYDSNPTLTGSPDILDKWWPTSDGAEQRYSKEGAVVIPPGGTLSIQFVGDHTAGNLYARLSYFVSSLDSLTI